MVPAGTATVPGVGGGGAGEVGGVGLPESTGGQGGVDGLTLPATAQQRGRDGNGWSPFSITAQLWLKLSSHAVENSAQFDVLPRKASLLARWQILKVPTVDLHLIGKQQK